MCLKCKILMVLLICPLWRVLLLTTDPLFSSLGSPLYSEHLHFASIHAMALTQGPPGALQIVRTSQSTPLWAMSLLKTESSLSPPLTY